MHKAFNECIAGAVRLLLALGDASSGMERFFFRCWMVFLFVDGVE